MIGIAMRLRYRPRTCLITTAAAIPVLLTGCARGIQPPNTLFIAYGIEDSWFSKESKTLIEGRITEFTENFKRTSPNTNVVLFGYKFGQLEEQIISDTKLNLGPDLIVSASGLIKSLHNKGYVDALPARINWDQTYSPLLKEIASIKGQYVAAPVLIFTQVACYNKRTVPASPQTIQELEELTASGTRVGLSLEPQDLWWTAGSMGAIKEMSALGLNKSKTTKFKSIRSWLTWLRKAALYKNISFFKSELRKDESLINGELDWISCDAGGIEQLRNKMGDTLGVSALPNGAQTAAFPIPYFISFGLGSSSSKSQRDAAIKYIQSSTNLIVQRQLMLRNTDFLPTNKNVSIPTRSSQALQAVNTSFNDQVKGYSEEWPGVIRFISGKKNNPNRYQELRSALADLISGYLTVDQTLDIFTSFSEGSKP